MTLLSGQQRPSKNVCLEVPEVPTPRQARRGGEEILVLLIVEQGFQVFAEGVSRRVTGITRQLEGKDDGERRSVLFGRQLQIVEDAEHAVE